MKLPLPELAAQSSTNVGLSQRSVTDSQQKFNGCFTSCQKRTLNRAQFPDAIIDFMQVGIDRCNICRIHPA
jgi:hypothetical protein